jgi:hypothetical protein
MQSFSAAEYLEPLRGVLRVVGEELWHWKRFPIVLPEPVTQSNGSRRCHDVLEIDFTFAGRMTLGGQKKTLRLEDLFIQPDFNEVKAIAVDANGDPRKLNGDQLASLRRTGEFAVGVELLPKPGILVGVFLLLLQVNSVQFPGQKHQWLVSSVLVKGKEKALKTFHCDLGRAAYLIRKVTLSSGINP